MTTSLGVLGAMILLLLSGIADAYGFFHGSRAWNGGVFHGDELLKSVAGFSIGMTIFWLAVRAMSQVGTVAPEVQALAWFGVTTIGVAVLSGEFFTWRLADQAVSALVICGIGWLLFRTGEV
ncbi:MAG: hypothetical protein ACT4PZ_09280 [Panacagrimonas sp.]